MLRHLILTSWLALAAGVLAQDADEPDDSATAAAVEIQAPPAPALPPEAALQTFQLQPGFRIELVAAEPLVRDPVAIAFDPDGQLWVVEMRGFMPNIEGLGEQEPLGCVVVLTDTNGDARMDQRRVFLEGLVMPRALALVGGGVLVAEPPRLWFCRDRDGDGRCDEKREVAGDYAVEADPKLGPRANPQHAANGLLWALDNWIYSANWTTRLRYAGGEWRREPTIFRGQWGLTQDDCGRLFYNSNEDQLRGDLVPAEYLGRNPHFRHPSGANVQVAPDQRVWPSRVTPGVNRGYRPGVLHEGRLARFTAACAPLIYRGDNFPEEFHGNAFVAEPAGNLIKRNLLLERDGFITATNASDGVEFLTSTDERFRPVNLAAGPDGALYIVDMYRGIIQHRIYVTPYLRQQIEARDLESPIHVGRIWRVVPDKAPARQPPALSRANTAGLVKLLSHPNGWHRDTAQRLLIERADAAVLPALKKAVSTSHAPLGRLHALWTLAGLERLDSPTLMGALRDPHEKVRAAAVRLSERLLRGPSKGELLPKLLGLTTDPGVDVRLQLAFTLGNVLEPQAETALLSLLTTDAQHTLIRDAVLSGLGNRELAFLERLLAEPAWKDAKPGRDSTLEGLAECVFESSQSGAIVRLVEMAAAQPQDEEWRRLALLDGIARAAPKSKKGQRPPELKPVALEAEPAALAALGKLGSPAVNERLEKITALITWPGKANGNGKDEAAPLTPEQQARFEAGKELYLLTCASCHQLHGNGQEGLAPPLVGSDWVTGSEQRLVRIVLNGMHGPVRVKGKVFELDMPALAVLEDDQIGALLTYVRREWGHTAAAVESETVKKIREATADRMEGWTEEELLKIP
jgi:putative membrane-bound dehydrogenase-like protein